MYNLLMSKKLPSLRVPYGQAVHGKEETRRVLAVLNEHRTIMGREIAEFERRVSRAFGKKHGIMVNSGSSANLLAVELLQLPLGSEIITPLLTFSTTVGPIVQKGLVPVFVDVVPGTYVVNIDQVERAITKKTRAIMIPWLIGNVPDVARLRALAQKHNLYFIEDSCDTFAATFNGKPTGTYTDITTTSFYGSHIITAGGNGGMIMVNRPSWRDRLKVLRGWGRTSSLFAESESLTKRFRIKLHGIPYDAKFIFDEIGYNLLPSEMGAAFGNAQLDKVSQFKKIREKNFSRLLRFFRNYEETFILPKQDSRVRTQWLAFPLTIRKNAPFGRLEIVKYLEQNNIQTRPIFTGNVLKQPGFRGIPHRTVTKSYPATNEIMERGFVIGCHHGLEDKQITKLEQTFASFLAHAS